MASPDSLLVSIDDMYDPFKSQDGRPETPCYTTLVRCLFTALIVTACCMTIAMAVCMYTYGGPLYAESSAVIAQAKNIIPRDTALLDALYNFVCVENHLLSPSNCTALGP